MIRRRNTDEHPLPKVYTQADLDAARAILAADLLACPFCKGVTKPLDGRSLGGPGPKPQLCLEEPKHGMLAQTWVVRCYTCGARGPHMDGAWPAMSAWNRRAP